MRSMAGLSIESVFSLSAPCCAQDGSQETLNIITGRGRAYRIAGRARLGLGGLGAGALVVTRLPAEGAGLGHACGAVGARLARLLVPVHPLQGLRDAPATDGMAENLQAWQAFAKVALRHTSNRHPTWNTGFLLWPLCKSAESSH